MGLAWAAKALCGLVLSFDVPGTGHSVEILEGDTRGGASLCDRLGASSYEGDRMWGWRSLGMDDERGRTMKQGRSGSVENPS